MPSRGMPSISFFPSKSQPFSCSILTAPRMHLRKIGRSWIASSRALCRNSSKSLGYGGPRHRLSSMTQAAARKLRVLETGAATSSWITRRRSRLSAPQSMRSTGKPGTAGFTFRARGCGSTVRLSTPPSGKRKDWTLPPRPCFRRASCGKLQRRISLKANCPVFSVPGWQAA